MSSHNKHIQQIEKILRNDLRRMDRDELYFMYGIQISSTGAVYDTVNELTYHSVDDWMDVYLDDTREDKEYIGISYEWDD